MVKIFRLIALVAASGATVIATAAKPAAPPTKTERIAESVDFDQLGQHIGREVAVYTKFGTRRVGTLLKANNTAMILKLGPADGGIDLDVPRDTVRKIELATEMDAPVGDSRAKKK